MKQRTLITLLTAATFFAANAQISPQSYSATHSDSCWHFTLDYNTPKPASSEGMLIVTHLCTPDTCISSAERHIQGKRYAKRYAKRHGRQPKLQSHGPASYTLIVPEEVIHDTVYGVTYCEYSDNNGTTFTCDTFAMCMPPSPPMSSHRVHARKSIADHLARDHKHVQNIRYYTPLTDSNAPSMSITPSIVRYRSNSSKLDPQYLQNAQSIDEIMSIIGDILADSTTTLEAVQIAGYTLPDGSEDKATMRGKARAMALRDHIRKHHHLPDSIFEVAGGGRNWKAIYDDIIDIGMPDGEQLVTMLQSEPSHSRREAMLRKHNGGTLYNQLNERYFPAHRAACCTGIYYHNKPDSVAIALNSIADELLNNPKPHYDRLLDKLKHYNDDPRALNLKGVIEYRRHHRHAAEKAFAKAAAMGDEQAMLNLQIIEYNKNIE